MAINERIKEIAEDYVRQREGWERDAAREISGMNVQSLDDALGLMDSARVEIRIIGAQLLGSLGEKGAIDRLVSQLGDKDYRSTDYAYGVWQCDEEEKEGIITVGECCAMALVRLGYAGTVEEVYKKANINNKNG